MTIERPVEARSSLSIPLAQLAELVAMTPAWQEWVEVYTASAALERVHLVSPTLAEPAYVAVALPESGGETLEFEADIPNWPDAGVVQLLPASGGVRETVRYLERGADFITVEAENRGLYGTSPTAGELGDVATVTPRVRRPFAVVDDGETLDFTLASTGSTERFRQQGDLFLLIEAPIPPELQDHPRDAKVWFLNQAGYLRDELVETGRRHGALLIRDVRKRMGPMWPDEAEAETEGHFMQLVFSIDYGAG